jgi:outer membrane immunogenic protein
LLDIQEFRRGHQKMRSKITALLLVSAAAVVTAQSAVAADLPARPIYKAPAAVAAWDWTGPYIGAYVGVAVSKSRGLDPSQGGNPGDLEHTGYGFTGGGTVGYNYQLNWGILGQKFVIGAEGDIGYFDVAHRVGDFNEFGPALTYDNKTSWLGTARARIGLTDGPNLNYFTGGYAAVHYTDVNFNPESGVEVSSSKTKSGYVIGSGVETMLGGGWTAKTEALYINVGSGDLLFNPTSFSIQNDKLRYYTQRFGVNYLFGGGKNGPLPQTNWNGLYVGGVFGGAVASVRGTGDDASGVAGHEIGNNGSGFTAGGQVGWNWMIAPKWVVGVEGDISYLGIDHNSSDYFNVENLALLGVDTSWLATARGRIAYNTGPALLYATGGGAWVHTKDSFTTLSGIASSAKTLSGWTVGGGIETVLWGNWSSKTEYLYVDAGHGDTYTGTSFDPFTITADHKFHLFRSGIVYRFSGNPLSGY